MTNAGLEHSLGARGIALHRTPVGDRHVEEALRKHGLHVGAEPSGHVCFDDGLPTADGALTALRVLVGGLDLDARLQGYRPWPSLLRNLRVARRPPLDAPGPLADARREAELAVTPGGRVILRYSGTEPRLRVLVEGPDEAIVAAVSSTLVSTLERLTGEP
jgi:phosphoglucosamine mutase